MNTTRTITLSESEITTIRDRMTRTLAEQSEHIYQEGFAHGRRWVVDAATFPEIEPFFEDFLVAFPVTLDSFPTLANWLDDCPERDSEDNESFEPESHFDAGFRDGALSTYRAAIPGCRGGEQ